MSGRGGYLGGQVSWRDGGGGGGGKALELRRHLLRVQVSGREGGGEVR